MSSRTYLSIGDVLSLLREEFPDVTISKIRFLESQGLVNPERSPSGYRKFFEHDVERLRWVLRQQREHFLPLKVIRDRLADTDLENAEGPNGKPAAGPAMAATPAMGSGSGETDRPTKADEEAMARILADASRRAGRLPDEAPARRGVPVDAGHARTVTTGVPASGAPGSPQGAAESARAAGTAGRSPAARTARSTGSTGSAASAGTVSSGGGADTTADPPDTTADPPDTSADPPDTSRKSGGNGARRAGREGDAPARAGGSGRQTGKGAAPAEGKHGASDIVTGASLNLEELCAASGLSAEEVAGLESFGLVRSVRVAGITTYDEDALTVANLAATFRTFGIEPRHLRLYRNAVDRELGLIEQVVIPLLRQRNPESRQKAVDAMEQLAVLGQQMRATLLQVALRQQLGG